MENTIENKSKFFAQYWGQKVLRASKNHELTWTITDSNNPVESEYLNLKPLSAITDEDRDYCVSMWRGVFKKEFDLSQGDFLRSKGYALPWMGLSVETMIEYGWIKLAEI